jgi:hypothetical protein
MSSSSSPSASSNVGLPPPPVSSSSSGPKEGNSQLELVSRPALPGHYYKSSIGVQCDDRISYFGNFCKFSTKNCRLGSILSLNERHIKYKYLFLSNLRKCFKTRYMAQLNTDYEDLST